MLLAAGPPSLWAGWALWPRREPQLTFTREDWDEIVRQWDAKHKERRSALYLPCPMPFFEVESNNAP
jgi:hypothetical protein